MMTYDCVFVYLNLLEDYFTGAEYQIDSAYVRMYLEKQGFHTIQYINQYSQLLTELVDELIQYRTKYYVFYINEYNYATSRLMIHQLKEKSCNIIIFGPSTLYIVNQLHEDFEFDYALMKHEQIVLQNILLDEQVGRIKNLAYRKKQEIHVNETKQYTYSLDEIGLPYSEGYIPVQEAVNVGMITSKGCYGDCSFCSYNQKDHIYYSHSIPNVLKEIDYIYQCVGGYNSILRFYDDCFSLNRERTIELLTEMKKRKYRLKFWCCTRADLITEEIVDLMKECNFYQSVIGLETASNLVMNELGKVKSDDSADAYIKRVSKIYQYAKSIGCRLMFSINFGLPKETLEDAKKTIEFVINNQATEDASVCFMTAFPGSKVFESSKEYQVVKEESPNRLPFRTYYQQYNMMIVLDQLYNSNIIRDGIDKVLKNISLLFIKAYTGIYMNENLQNAIDMIFVDEMSEEVLRFLNRNIKLNGDVVMRKDKISLNPLSFCEDRKKLRVGMAEYDSYLKMAYQKYSYLPNLNFVKENSTDIYIQRNNLYLHKVAKIPMKEISSLSELESYNEHAKRFVQDHRIPIKEIREANIKDLCRLSGRCSIIQLRAARISKGNVYPRCGNEPMGNLENDYSILVKKLVEQKQTLLKERQCEQCKASRWCSKCLCLSNLFGTERKYCEYMKKHVELLQYFRVISKLNDYFNFFHFEDSEEVFAYLLEKNHFFLNQYLVDSDRFLVYWKEDILIFSLVDASVSVCSVPERKVIRAILFDQKEELKEGAILSLAKKGFLLRK